MSPPRRSAASLARPLAGPLLTRSLVCIPALILLVGCAGSKGNASFDITPMDAQRALAEMRGDPKPLRRPLVILSGYFDPGLAAGHLRKEFRHLTGDERVIGVSFLFCGNFDACRRQVIAAVDRAFPSGDPDWTTEVDVVGVSMGGLVGRYAAVPVADKPDARRLRVARLFTIGTPHRGAAMAAFPTFNKLQIDMRADSRFLRQLAEAEAQTVTAAATTGDGPDAGGGYELYPYVRLGDAIVGAENAAPPGQTPWWVPGEPLQASHAMASMDPRIIADVARRLRGEEPLTREPPAPLPSQKPAADAEPERAHAQREPDHGTSFALQQQ